MKFLKSHGETLVFQVVERERKLFVHTLRMYPLLNPDYHRIVNKSSDAKKLMSHQIELREAMKEHHDANRKLVEEFITRKLIPVVPETGVSVAHVVSLTRAQVNWLLEVLNDVRVGSWVKLGRPDQDATRSLQVKSENVVAISGMEFSGYLQMILLEALRGAA